MNEKLLIRAAIKFRQWMIEQSQRPPDTFALGNQIIDVITKSHEIQKWTRRFVQGLTKRVQVSEYPPHNKSYGISTPSVYKDIATHMVPDLCENITCNMGYISGIIKSMAEPEKDVVTPLSPREAYEEIRIINDVWPDTEYKNGILSVIFRKVVLEDGREEVDLGDFRIDLHLGKPIDGLSVKSLSYLESERGFFHPHVSGERLCTGNGGLSMVDALCQGRLEDYFRVVEAIVRTYNDVSPYEPLTEWYDPQHEDQFFCEDCDAWRPDESSCFCDGCGHSYCDNCDTSGGCCTDCGNWRCGECSNDCADCGEVVCNNCNNTCDGCGYCLCEKCVSSCVACEEYFCSKCCSECCAYCGDKMCGGCTIKCGCCEDNCCKQCVDDNCCQCDVGICKGCDTTCYECGETVCRTCVDNECEGCGNSMCKTCVEEHTCLLQEVNDAR